MKANLWLSRCLTAAAIVGATLAAHAQEALPAQLAGSWRITRMLPTRNTGCWDGAKTLVGTTITYRPSGMRWQGGDVPLQGIVTRTVTPDLFEKETASTWGTPLRLSELNIQAARVTEVDLQHEDADITGSTTEIPGDSVLLVGRNTIVVSACGAFFEATRPGLAASAKTPAAKNLQTPIAKNTAFSPVKPSKPASSSFQTE